MGSSKNLKNWVIISIFLLGLVAEPSFADPNLLAHYTFDDGTADDSSGNTHHGTIVPGDASTSISIVYDAERDSNVLDVDNPPGHTINSVVDCGTGAWANIQSAITLAAWTKVHSIHTTCYLMTKGSPYQMTGLPAPDGRFRAFNNNTVNPGNGLNQATYSTSSLLDGEWHHVAVTYDSIAQERKVYFDGVLEDEEPVTGLLGTTSNAFVIGGRLATGYYHRGWNGLIDDFRVYDNAVTHLEILEMAEKYEAYNPVPADGELDVSLTLASIGWKPGIRAAGTNGEHKVYIGQDEPNVIAGTGGTYKGQFDANSYSGSPMGSLTQGTQYYWRITAVNIPDALEWPGDVWSFTTVHEKATEPNPVDTAKYVGTPRARVSWKPGTYSTRDAVYFGTSKALIDANDPDVYRGQVYYSAPGGTNDDPNWAISPALVADETYYWRIDVNFPSWERIKGNVWSFTTSIVVADPNFLGWWKFDEKAGNVVFDATGREHYGTLTQGQENTSIDIVYDADWDSNVLDANNPYPGNDNWIGSVVDADGTATDILDPCWADIQAAVTIAGWTKLEPMVTTNYLLSKGARYQLTATANDPVTNASDGRIRVYTNEYVFADSSTYSVGNVKDGQWHHLACTYDSGTKKRIIYIDGDAENTEVLTPVEAGTVFPLLDWTSSKLVIGGRIDPGFRYRAWNGLVRDVRLYDRALSECEIRTVAGLPPPRVIYVDANAGPGGDGSSWATAFEYLQDALSEAASCDHIWVAEGIYTPDSNSDIPDGTGERDATFQLINCVNIKGGYAGIGEPDPNERDVELYETILSGDLDGNDTQGLDPYDLLNDPNRCENSYHVVTGSYTDETAILDGFTITGGNASEIVTPHNNGGGMNNHHSNPTVANCTFSCNSAYDLSGGMYNVSSSPTVTNCTFSENTSGRGSGMGNQVNSKPTLTNCIFSGNSTRDLGGGMYNSNSDPTLTNCTFRGNIAIHWGGGMFNYDNSSPTVTSCIFSDNNAGWGGGMMNFLFSSPTLNNCSFTGNFVPTYGSGMANLDNSSPMLTNCTFSGNSAEEQGGGMYNSVSSSPTVTNCTFSGNSAGHGGGMFNWESNPTLTNCTFSDNWAVYQGGGIADGNNSSPMVTNCTFSENSADLGGGMRNWDNSSPTMTNCTFTGNSAVRGGGILNTNSTATVANCILWGNTASTGPQIYNDPNSTATVSYSDVQGGWAGPGNIDAEPSLTPDGHLRADSVCIDAGDPNFVVDPGAPTDMDGESRIIGRRVDIGADEFLDTDSDGLPDWWEQEYFGDPIAAEPGADPDGDEVTNLQEYELYGSNPVISEQIIYVDDSAVGNNDGSSWTDAYKDLQDALSLTISWPFVEEIHVAQGSHKPDQGTGQIPGDRSATFQLINGVALYGGYAGYGAPNPNARDIDLYETILSGDIGTPGDSSDNSYHVVTGSGTDATAVLDGFTITAGNANSGSPPNGDGAGMYNDSGSPTVKNCTFSGNSAHTYGGGMYNRNNSSPTVTNCTFSGNSADWAGGGMLNDNSSPKLTNCVFSGNSAFHLGGGMVFSWSSNPTLVNCTLSGNSAQYGGGMNTYESSNSTLRNCILWGNEPDELDGSGYTVSYSNIEGGFPGTGNINADPLFADADLRLSAGSPCIDAGDNTAVPGGVTTDLDGTARFADDPYTVDTGSGTPPIVDMGAYEKQPRIYVDEDAGGDNNGASWADAFTDLQDALAIASSGDEIWVAAGSYTPDAPAGDRSATFQLISGVEIYGGFDGSEISLEERDWQTNETILSGDLNGDDVGFTNNGENSYHVVTGSRTDASTVLDGFTITAGNAEGSSPWGSGLLNDAASLTVRNCTFSGNSGTYGAMNNWSGSPTITNCTFSNNSATGSGAALGNNYCSPTITNCTFTGNSAAGWGGGAILNNNGSDATVTNCMFTGNSANVGGAILNRSSNPTVTNCTFAGNSAVVGNGLACDSDNQQYPSTVQVSNCIFWDGGDEIWNNDGSTITINYSDIQGSFPGTGNIAADPCFVDANNSDYHLQAGSPCIDAGDPHGDYVGQTDIDGEPRVIGFYVDIGSDESNDVIVADYYVDDDAPDDPGPGNPGVSDPLEDGSWQHPFDAIQEAITAATGGNIIGVRDGTYTGNGNRNIDFGGKAITVFSRGPENCIIDCEGAGRGFYFHSGEDGNSVVEGFTITNGYADPGGGIYCDNSSPMISNCTFSGNEGTGPGGGGVYCNYSSPTISNCTFSDNTAQYGGAIRCFHGTATISNCVINGNTADYEGGGICFYFTNSMVSNCTISSNVTGARGGGISCYDSEPIVSDSVIRDNSIDGIHLYDVDSTIQIRGLVEIISNNVLGEGFVQIDPNAILNLDDAEIFANMAGAGTMEVDAGAELIIDGNAVIDLGDPYDPNIKGTIDCEGVLEVKDNAKITNANINITRASFTDDVNVSNSVITVDSNAPYGQFFIDANATFIYNDIYADGDRYMDLDPNIFAGLFVYNRIFVTITEGVGQTRGGLFECRGEDGFADVNSCDPNNTFFCQVNPGSIPDCNMKTWTLERLELIAGAKLNLTNRFPFQPPYDPGTDYDVVYVKELILRQNSVLNTSFNKIYYGTLISEPNAAIKNVPLLGFSLINIAFDDDIEFIVRVMHNNYTHPNDPNYNRIHVERVTGSAPDPDGMMRMCNLADFDPCSSHYQEVVNARAKGLFAKSNEDKFEIWFEYLFETSDPNVELVVFLTDVPELLDHNDPNRADHYIEVARLRPPPTGQPGSAGSGRFGKFQQYVWREDLDFIRGTRIEFELIGYCSEGTSILINNWDPENCIYCGDVSGDFGVTVSDFLYAVKEYGTEISDDNYEYMCAFDTLAFSSDGGIDISDCMVWDWGNLLKDRGLGSFCPSGFYNPIVPCASTESLTFGQEAGPLDGFTGCGAPLLVAGKHYDSAAADFLSDRLYGFDTDCNLICGPFAMDNDRDRLNHKLVRDHQGQLYQLNLEDGLVRLSDQNSVIPQGSFLGIGSEPRYGEDANVYVGLQGGGTVWSGHPIMDAAFDSLGYVYVTPVVVEPDFNEAYLASAKLQLAPSSYSLVKLYDDPDADNPADQRQLNALREIEVDNAGNLYVINSHSHNESDILWVYDTGTGEMKKRLELVNPNIEDINIPAPIGMHVSDTTGMLYLASSLNQTEANSVSLYALSTGDLSLARTIDINNMGHITDITEDPTSDTIWVIGIKIKEKLYPLSSEPPFYEPYIAEIPSDSNDPVQAVYLSDTNPEPNLAMPMSIVWTGDKCAGADLDGSSDVDFIDFAILANQWHQSPGSPSADIAPEVLDSFVDERDLAILAKHWLNTGCTSP